MLNVSIRQIRVFTTVARHLSFARAAEELHLSAPAVSMQIRDLEGVLGVPLFERGGRRVALTTGGEYFLLHARKVLSSLKDAEDTIARLKGARAGRIQFGLVSTAKYFAPRLLAGFLHDHPGVEVGFAVGNREQLIEMLKRGEVDFAVMGTPPRELETRSEPFAMHPLGVVAAPEHPLAALPHVPPTLLASEPFVVREPGSGTRAAMDRYFRDQRIQPPMIMEMTSNETIKQAVIANMGIAFLSLHTIGLERAAGVLRVLDVDGLPLVRRWQLVHAQGKLLSPPAEALRYYMLERGEELLARMFGPPSGDPSGADAAASPVATAPASR